MKYFVLLITTLMFAASPVFSTNANSRQLVGMAGKNLIFTKEIEPMFSQENQAILPNSQKVVFSMINEEPTATKTPNYLHKKNGAMLQPGLKKPP